MANSSAKDEILAIMDRLPADRRQQIADFARALAKTEAIGLRGERLLQFAGAIDRQDLLLMTEAIEEDCEKVDRSAW